MSRGWSKSIDSIAVVADSISDSNSWLRHGDLNWELQGLLLLLLDVIAELLLLDVGVG